MFGKACYEHRCSNVTILCLIDFLFDPGLHQISAHVCTLSMFNVRDVAAAQSRVGFDLCCYVVSVQGERQLHDRTSSKHVRVLHVLKQRSDVIKARLSVAQLEIRRHCQMGICVSVHVGDAVRVRRL